MTPDQFWQLVEQSRLYRSDELETLRKDYALLHGDQAPAEARPVAEWLLAQRKITGFQARQLLRGRSGPFHFGEYQVLQRRPVATKLVDRYDAIHTSTRHRVILHLWPSGTDVASYERLADQHREIRHANVDRYYETVSYKNSFYGVSECPEGESLRQMLEDKRRLPVAKACHLMHQAAVGLAHLHAVGIVHGCLRPDEIAVQTGGHVKLVREPFFQARVDLSSMGKLRPGLLPHYLAPEFHRTQQADERTDIYAMGCVLFELLMGSPPFDGESSEEVLAAHRDSEVAPPESRNDIPNGLWDVLSYSLAKDRNQRYPKAIELAEKLEPFLPSGISQTSAKHRPTETLYLSHLDKNVALKPKHLAQPDQPKNVDLILDPTAEVAKRSKSRSRGPYLVAAASAIGLGIVLAILQPWRSPVASTTRPDSADPSKTVPETSVRTNGDDSQVESNGPNENSLWASPTAGEPIDLAYTPAGAQLFLTVRIQDLLKSSEGERAVRALGPRVAAVLDQFEQEFGVSSQSITRLTIAYTSQNTTEPIATMIGVFDESAYLSIREGMSLEDEPNGAFGKRSRHTLYFPADAPRTVVWGTAEEIELIRTEPGTPPLRREMNRLLQETDREHQLTILFAPNFIAADGQALLKGALEPLRRRVLDFVGDRTQAACVGASLGETFFIELKWVTQFEENPLTVALSRRQQMLGFPEAINDFLGRITIDRYWQPVAIRYPLMVNYLTQQTRVGVGDGFAIMNAALPPEAAHNLILASELSLASADTAVEIDVASTADTQQLSTAQILELPVDFEITQLSLDAALRELGRTVAETSGAAGIAIEIIGRDLQGDGITRNQQIRNLSVRGETLRKVLTEITRRGNPLPVESPKMLDQKLIWVENPAVPQALIITTRAAAERKGYRLPPEFVAD